MERALLIIQIVLAVTLIAVILMQVRGQGQSLFGAAEGGYRTRRGLEKTLFQFTVAAMVVFLAISLIIVRVF
ncbi:MAG: preprotein translocase subunit SecG [SAR202 cluster bacterium]|nr:preprotein translocase subunit SecG [SAR202 cluster bacterium]